MGKIVEFPTYKKATQAKKLYDEQIYNFVAFVQDYADLCRKHKMYISKISRKGGTKYTIEDLWYNPYDGIQDLEEQIKEITDNCIKKITVFDEF